MKETVRTIEVNQTSKTEKIAVTIGVLAAAAALTVGAKYGVDKLGEQVNTNIGNSLEEQITNQDR